MLFSSPVPWEEAVASRTVRELLPTSLSSQEIATLPAEIRERAMFSARVPYVNHLAKLDRIIDMIVNPEFREDESGAMRPTKAGEYMNEALARKLLRDSLDEEGYAPTEGEEGSLTDLSSEKRIHLQVQMNVDFARGYGTWAQGMDDDVLNEFPAQRFTDSVAEHPRDWDWWESRWEDAGLPVLDSGEQVALKTDPGWALLSIFGLPYPPFAWGSTRDLEDVDRDEAEDLGLLAPTERLTGQRRPFAEGMQALIPTPANSLMHAILRAMPGARFDNGILSQGGQA